MAVDDLANRIASFVSAGVKTTFLLTAADGIAVRAVLWTYRRPVILVMVGIDGRIYWQSSRGLGRSSRRTGRPCWMNYAVF